MVLTPADTDGVPTFAAGVLTVAEGTVAEAAGCAKDALTLEGVAFIDVAGVITDAGGTVAEALSELGFRFRLAAGTLALAEVVGELAVTDGVEILGGVRAEDEGSGTLDPLAGLLTVEVVGVGQGLAELVEVCPAAPGFVACPPPLPTVKAATCLILADWDTLAISDD